MQIESYKPSSNYPHELRSYSTSYSSSSSSNYPNNDIKLKKGKSTNETSSSSSSSSSWGFGDPEFQRKKRVASYKTYAVEGKIKGSFRKSFRWLKLKYSQVVYGL
ncbi:uncharacterized protein LOC124932446 [Impatiens glandulifera]|uniref:uncharacterized protein LOC124932446 n=1 Tax=Impatiens glandulifera TaxID=253017 RepID=UPI001FB09791|nr:uncharacterized protein LOC124932446 [Impatiens glandulifera]